MSKGYEVVSQENVLQDTLLDFLKKLSFFVLQEWSAHLAASVSSVLVPFPHLQYVGGHIPDLLLLV